MIHTITRYLVLIGLVATTESISFGNGLCCAARGYVACVERPVSIDSASAYGNGTIRVTRFGQGAILVGASKQIPFGDASLVGLRCEHEKVELFASDKQYTIELSVPPPFTVRSGRFPSKGLPSDGVVDGQQLYICGTYAQSVDELLEADDRQYRYRLRTSINGDRAALQLDQLDAQNHKAKTIPLLQWKITQCLGDEAE